MNTDTEFDFLSLEEAAKILDVNVATLRQAIRSGKLTATHGIGYGFRTTRPWLRAFVGTATINPEAAGGSAEGDVA